MFKIGIDIGGTKINIGIIDENNRLIVNRKLRTSEIKNTAADIKSVICEMCDLTGISYGNIISCGVGIPGSISADGKKILKAPNISVLSENFAVELEKELNIPVTMLQDSRAAAWGEYICGGGVGYKTVICVTLGTGIGTGIVCDGKIYNGALGCAGELGHIQVKENGRKCGCGKCGCVEKYCAGGGLDITAAEILGEGKTAVDLFEGARCGKKAAQSAIDEAVRLLGSTLVSAVNLMSPDCILFSGGLSEQQDLYLNPVIEYIKSHCYSTGTLPYIAKAKLGENAPLMGAALAANEASVNSCRFSERRRPMLSASIMCADILNMGKALAEIKDAGIQYLHCDIMDNHFVPNLMLPMELLNKLKAASDLPFDYHIMAECPESIIEKLDLRKGDFVSVHYESTVHLNRATTMIREKGARAAVAINPATPISVLDEILPLIDMVLVMTVNPGFAGQKIVPTSFAKIAKMKQMLADSGFNDILIEVDGNCSFENVPKMYSAGADIFVVGTSSVFKKDISIKDATERLMATLRQ